ncbi:OmpH family outer membrane protein [Sporomusa malonica]|uniref:Periplasmic chaperone for outer membrane proteins Skp n=1 Tax=Sporomusa malonica TaxID=112901 RepID=A0A1W2DG46_9FIRM|nr:OmpH family outer membrane protein [Sporomusa malonica]SMC96254.1 periplasmic chaperone for outer membrane proteins Skp [Sporomusa malonica]
MELFIPKKFYRANLLAALGIFLAFGAPSAQAAPAAPAASPVGCVDFIYLVDHHPDTAKANEALTAEQEAVRQEFAAKSVGLGDREKQDLDRQLGQRLEQKRLELLKPITDKIVAAVKEVADAKGLSVVVGKAVVVYGGVDITEDVLRKSTGK